MPARAGLDRDSVVRAAADLLDERPGGELTLSELASRLGVRTPSLYNHVAGIDDLQRAVALYGTREMGRRIGRAAIGKSGDAAIVAIGEAYRAFAKERPGLYLAAQRAPAPGEDDRAEASDEVLDVLRLVLEPFELTPEMQIHAMRSLRSLVHGFVSLELIGGFGIPVDVDVSFQYLLRIMIAGFERQSGGIA
jgi:AcrR family transcriptional regulator